MLAKKYAIPYNDIVACLNKKSLVGRDTPSLNSTLSNTFSLKNTGRTAKHYHPGD